MNKSILKSLLGFTFISVLLFSCGKYEEGPSFSLVTKKNRVANTWKIDKVYVDDVDRTSLFSVLIDGYKIEFTKDDKVTETLTSILGTHTNYGTWEFGGSKETLHVTISGSKAIYRILRLSSSEMWLEEVTGGNKYVTHMVTA